MTEKKDKNVSEVGSEDVAFLKTNSLDDMKKLVEELADVGEDTKDISELIEELESLYDEISLTNEKFEKAVSQAY